MRFRSYGLGRPLSDFVENFGFCDGYASPHLREGIFPSGTFELLFNLRDGDLRIFRPAASRFGVPVFRGAVVSAPFSILGG
jgi:hypothetical protein